MTTLALVLLGIYFAIGVGAAIITYREFPMRKTGDKVWGAALNSILLILGWPIALLPEKWL